MLVLIGIGLAAGFITAISPCVLPVLPIVFAGGATGGRRKPFAIVAGLIASFSAFTLFGVWLLAATRPAAGHPARPRDRPALPRRGDTALPARRGDRSAPAAATHAAGPAASSAAASCSGRASASSSCRARARCSRRSRSSARRRTSARARSCSRSRTRSAPRVPMLLVAFGGRAGDAARSAARPATPPGARRRRRADGARDRLQRRPALPDRDPRLHGGAPEKVEQSERAQRELAQAEGQHARARPRARPSGTSAPAPELHRASRTGSTATPLTLAAAARQGRPRRLLDVLVHQLPAHAAAREGLGPHLPRPRARRRSASTRPSSPSSTWRTTCEGAVRRLGVQYPVALDNDYGTWNAFQNQYWPAKYLIDRSGHLRYYHFGEGEYDTTEARIRTLLGESAGTLPVRRQLSDPTPKTVADARDVPRLPRGSPASRRRTVTRDRFAATSSRTAARSRRARVLGDLAGRARSEIVAGLGARLRLRFHARKVLPRARRRGSVGVLARREAAADGARRREPPLHAPPAAARCGAACSSCASARAFGATPSRSASALSCCPLANGGSSSVAPSSRSRRKRVSSAASASPDGSIGLLGERVGALLELLDVRRGVRVGGDGLRDLLRVVLGRLGQLARVDLGAEQVGEPVAERQRRLRARRQRDVVRNRRPEARRGDARPAGTHRGGRRRFRSGPRSGRPRGRGAATSSASVALPVTGQGRVCGTSASSAPSVTTSSMPSSPRNVTIMSVNVRQRRFGSMPSSRTTSRSSPAGGRGRRPSPASRSSASGPPRARRAGASPGSRRSSPDRSPRSAPPPRASRGNRSASEAPWPPSFQPRNAAIRIGRSSSGRLEI